MTRPAGSGTFSTNEKATTPLRMSVGRAVVGAYAASRATILLDAFRAGRVMFEVDARRF